jgi:hypothetical protein
MKASAENPMNTAAAAFWVDRDHDRSHASDGISRDGAYLRDASFEPWTDNDQAVGWAVFAWERATGRVMSPGYVRYHLRVLAARLGRSGCDGSLVAGVTLGSLWPEEIKTALSRAIRLGDPEVYWRDWPMECLGGDTVSYHEPSEADVAARPYLLTTVSGQFTVPPAALPGPPAASPARLEAGQQALAVQVDEPNRVVGPVLRVVLGDGSPAAGSAR